MGQALIQLRDRFDRVGILLSGLCAVHCLATLVLVTALGLTGGALLDPAIHRVGGIAIGIGVARHGKREPLWIGVFGLALMALALAAGHGATEAVATISGVALVALAHWRNVRHLA